MGSSVERGIGVSFLANLPVVAKVAGCIFVHLRCVVPHRIDGQCNGQELLVVYIDLFRAVSRLLQSVSNHNCNRVTYVAYRIDGKCWMGWCLVVVAVLTFD